VVDSEREHIMTEMFRRVSENGNSGRTIKRWLDQVGFTIRTEKKVTLSIVYQMLKNPFYYGELSILLKTDYGISVNIHH